MDQADRRQLAARVFEYSRDGIVIIDGLGRILDANRAFADAVDCVHGELCGKGLQQLGLDGETPGFVDHLCASLEDKGIWCGEVRKRHCTGDVRWGRLHVSALGNDDGRASHYVGILTDITQLKTRQVQLEHMAHHDALTQLPNRVLFFDRLRMAASQARRSGKWLAVCYLDLDGFKPVNDRFGHDFGDRLLVEVGQRLKSCLREGDTVARLGGDEFALLLGELDSVDEVHWVLARIMATIALPIPSGQDEDDISLSVSAGIALFPQDGEAPGILLHRADQAMYQAKQKGSNGYYLFNAGPDCD